MGQHGVGDNMSNLIASNMITQITLGLSEVPRILLLDSLSDCALLKACVACWGADGSWCHMLNGLHAKNERH